MGRAARLQQFLQRAERGDPDALAILAVVVASVLVLVVLRLRRHFRRKGEGG